MASFFPQAKLFEMRFWSMIWEALFEWQPSFWRCAPVLRAGSFQHPPDLLHGRHLPSQSRAIPGFSPCYAQGIAHFLQKAGVQESYRDLARIPTHPEHSLSSRNAGWLRNTEGRLFPERKPSGPSSRRKGPHSWLPQFRVQWTPWFTYHKLLNFLIEILFLQ